MDCNIHKIIRVVTLYFEIPNHYKKVLPKGSICFGPCGKFTLRYIELFLILKYNIAEVAYKFALPPQKSCNCALDFSCFLI